MNIAKWGLIFVGLLSFDLYAAPVNINTADARTITESLAGIGQKKAEAIVADRTKNGPFKSIEDLKRVTGIGDKIISTNRGNIILTDKPETAQSKPATTTPANIQPTNTNPGH